MGDLVVYRARSLLVYDTRTIIVRDIVLRRMMCVNISNGGEIHQGQIYNVWQPCFYFSCQTMTVSDEGPQ